MTRWGCTTFGKWIIPLACALGLQAALSSAGFAQTIWRPLPLDRTTPSGTATVPRELASSLRIGSLPVDLAKTPLVTVQAQLGGTLGHVGDASESLSWLCVQGTDPAGRWVLWLESAEIDEDLVGSFQLRRLAPRARVDHRCAIVQGPADVELPLKLALGMPRARVLQRLGRPSVESGKRLLYLHQHDELKVGNPTAGPQPFPVRNDLVILLRQGIAHAVGATKYTLW